MESETKVERDRCERICRQRAELWRSTMARNPAAGAREEARGRANEAEYLADLIASGIELSELAVVVDDKPDA